jgi:hypothetical protein
MGRQAKGSGTVFYRESDGRWVGEITVGKKPDGKPIKRTVYARSSEEAFEKLDQVKRAYQEDPQAVNADQEVQRRDDQEVQRSVLG